MNERAPQPRPEDVPSPDAMGEEMAAIDAAVEAQGQRIPVTVAEEQPKPEPAATESTHGLRPVGEGEWDKMVKERPKLMDENDPDYLPIAAMGHEPWTFDLKEDKGKSGEQTNPPEESNKSGQETPGTDKSGEIKIPKEVSDKIKDATTKRVKKGEEAGQNKDTAEDEAAEDFWDNPEDPRKRIGKAVKERIDEIKADGKSEADAHAEAHDEFWGKTPEASSGGGIEVPPENPENP